MFIRLKGVYKMFIYLMQVLLIFCCSGCGYVRENDVIKNEQSAELELHNLAYEEWVGYNKIEENYIWTVTESMEDFIQAPIPGLINGESFSAVWGDTYYSINHFYLIEEESVLYEYYLYSIDTNTFGINTKKLVFDENEEEFKRLKDCLREGYARVTALDVHESKVYAFFAIWDEEQYIQDYFACEIDVDGKVKNILDLQIDTWGVQLLQKKQAIPPSAVCDKEGLFYVIDQEKGEIKVIDHNGVLKYTVVIQDALDERIYVCGKTSEGIPILKYTNLQGQTTIFSIEEGTRKILYLGEGADGKICGMDDFGRVLLAENGKVLCWHPISGQCQAIYDLDGLESLECTEIISKSPESIIMVLQNKTKTYLYRLIANESREQVELELLQMYPDEYTKICAAEYSRKKPGVTIKITEVQDDRAVHLNKTAELMKKGEGPDMLLLDKRQLITLQDADCLALLNDYLVENLEENIFAGAMEFGKIDNSLYAIPYEASIGTLIVANSTWNKSTWSIQEVVSLIEKMERNATMPERIYSIYYDAPADQLLYDLCLKNIENTLFLNIAEKTCNFEAKEFYELLSLCKKMGEEPASREYMTNLEMVEEVRSGKAIAYAVGGGLLEYSCARADFGDDYHCVGYPTNEGSGNQVHVYRGIAVNRQAEHKEIVKDFIQFMLSEENQLKYTTYWVRKDIIKEHVYENTELSDKPVFLMDDYSYIQLEGKEDGTSYVDEYIELMENGSLLSDQYAVQDIILEEASAYFVGDKTVQDVAKIIQNRVQLYLSEDM